MDLIELTLSELNGKVAIIIDYQKEQVYLIVETENLILNGKEAIFILESLERLGQHLSKSFQILTEPNSNIN